MNLKEVNELAWMKVLADTYDTYENLVGVCRDAQPVLLPIAHSTANAQIEITINAMGQLLACAKVEKGNEVTIIPVTEDSASRSSGVAPHSLCDKLCYIAKDYSFYTKENKEKYFEKYIEQLSGWVKSGSAHPMVEAIYRYLSKGTVICDLLEAGILELDADGVLSDKVNKIQGYKQTEAFVRFIVYLQNRDDETENRVWKNSEVYNNYVEYYSSTLNDKDVCYVTGKYEVCTDKHPSKIRNTADKAKLISGNDESGFTYRGRFANKQQAVTVGYFTSQKAHNALKWLLQKQGYRKDEAAFVSWMTNRDMVLPDIGKDSIHAYEKILTEEATGLDWLDFLDEPDENKEFDTGKVFAEKFNKAIQGYTEKIALNDRVSLIALDAATTGRISISYYDEMGGRQYISAIQYWYNHCMWERYITLDKKNKLGIWKESTPAPREMALAAYGVLRSSGMLEADSKLLRNTVQRLLPCITKNIDIPKDLVRAAVIRTSQPLAYYNKGFFVWENNLLRVTCAMIRYQYEKKKGDGKMGTFLEDNVDNRSVLFGRLLAVCDYMEQRAMFERDEKGKIKEQRQTNAKRYWNAYSMRPAATLKTLRENLVPYMKKLTGYEIRYFENCMEELMVMLADNGYDNRALSELYLPGYYLEKKQMEDYFKNNKKEKGEMTNE